VRAATGLKRLSLAVAALLVAGVAALFAASAVIPADTVRATVIAEIRSVTGLEPVVRGDVSVSLFPSATVSFTDVVLGEDRDGKAALTADRLTAKLRLLPMLIGRIETADVALMRPRLNINLGADGQSNWSGLIATLARSLKPGAKQADRVMSFSEIRMTGGTIAIRDAAHGVAETLSDVEVSLAWPSIARSFGATGRFSWRGEPFDVSINAGDLFAALTGERSGLKVRLAGMPFKVAFDGHMNHRQTLRVEGTVAADGPSLRQALRWAGRQPFPGGGFGLFAIKAQVAAVGSNVALQQVNVELDGNTAEGALSFTSEPRATLKGTLAAEALDLTAYVSTFEVMRADERNWSRQDISVGGLSDFDLDLRLSAARVTISTAKLGRTGVAANLVDGRLTLAIGEAQAFGGVVKGSLLLARSSAGADIKSLLQFSNVDLEQCFGELFGLRRLEGKGDFAISLEGSGDSVLALTRTLNGTATLFARQGALNGVNVEQLLRRLEQRPLSVSADFRRGRTPFEKLSITLKIAQGVAKVEDVALEGGALKLALGGLATIPTREIDLKGTAALVAATDGSGGFELPFVVQGHWDDPVMLPDARSLIRRSGALGPLLEALRDRKTRDAVREAIEKMSRDQAAASATEAPALASEPTPAGAAPPAAAPAAAPAASVPSK